jgi:hypothetical protein
MRGEEYEQIMILFENNHNRKYVNIFTIHSIEYLKLYNSLYRGEVFFS